MNGKRKAMPDKVFIGNKDRVLHKHVVFVIDEEDIEGVPLKLRMMLDADTVNVKGGEKFMTGYVPLNMTEPKR